MDGDSVVVDSLPPLSETYYVAIAGRVNKPGRFPWRPGMTLRELVELARGPKVGAYLKEAEIARLPEDRSRGQLATTLRVPLDSTYLLERTADGRFVGPPGVAVPARGTAEVPLQPYDNVLIMQEPQFDLQRAVVVSGQVRYPGTYSLRSKEDRLADVIERAGGLTPQAYPEGIQFVRSAGGVGRVNIDLPRALHDQRSSHNVILQPDDSIFIPEYQPTVKVVGAVNAPGSLLWRRGADLDYYISAAGGLLPKNLPSPPTYEKANPADAQLAELASLAVGETGHAFDALTNLAGQGYGSISDVATEAFGALRDESAAGYASVDSIANGALTFAGDTVTGLISQGKGVSTAVTGPGPNSDPPPVVTPPVAPPAPPSAVIKLPSLSVGTAALAAAACTAAWRCATAACAPPPAAPAAAAAFIAEGRSTMVFSKSAFSPLAAGAASPTNLSLYLPSSMTSLFCRKCFLIGLPLTTVPLVLPRSSRNESLRMVTMTACSPLTARLSIWMSLWGLRPMVVRSFVKGISLRTSPSMLSISFAISGPCGSLF